MLLYSLRLITQTQVRDSWSLRAPSGSYFGLLPASVAARRRPFKFLYINLYKIVSLKTKRNVIKDRSTRGSGASAWRQRIGCGTVAVRERRQCGGGHGAYKSRHFIVLYFYDISPQTKPLRICLPRRIFALLFFVNNGRVKSNDNLKFERVGVCRGAREMCGGEL